MTDRKVELYAHRGGRNWGPENTMCVFKKSLELGVDGLELDVQRCSSGELVVFHDEYLSRTTNGAGLLREASFDELQRLSAGSWFGPEFKDETIPLLEDVLALVDGQSSINIEVKNLPFDYEGIEEQLVTVLDQYKHIDKIIFSSFDHEVINKLAKLRPEWNYAVLMVGVPFNICDYLNSLNAKFWNPEHKSLHTKASREAKAAGVKILAWTANKPRDWSRLMELEVSGIITDHPSELKKFFDQIEA